MHCASPSLFEGWAPFFPASVHHLLRSEHASFLRDSISVCFAQQLTLRCFLPHSWRPGIASLPMHSALTNRAMVTAVACPPAHTPDAPPWETRAPIAGQGREAALPPSPCRPTQHPPPTVSGDVPPWREPKAAYAQILARAAEDSPQRKT